MTSARTTPEREAELDEFFAQADDVLTDWHPGRFSDAHDSTDPEDWRFEHPLVALLRAFLPPRDMMPRVVVPPLPPLSIDAIRFTDDLAEFRIGGYMYPPVINRPSASHAVLRNVSSA